MPDIPQLSEAARNTMKLFCQIHQKQAVTEHELTEITGASVLELADVGLVELPIELVGVEFKNPQTGTLTFRRNHEIRLTAAGQEYCAAN